MASDVIIDRSHPDYLRERIAELESQLIDLRAALEGKWISVDESLPEIGEKNRILAFVVDYENDFTFQIVTNRWESGYSNVLRGQKVTHYQPLPPAPKEATK